MIDDTVNYSPLEKRDSESELEYHKRIVYGKLKDKILSDYDYSELAPFVYNKDYSTDVARRMFYGSCKTLELLDKENIENISSDDILSEIDLKTLDLRKEKQKFSDERNALNKLIRERSRQEELNELIVSSVRNSNLPRLNYVPSAQTASDNDLLVSLNDIHYGAVVDTYWRQYNPDICVQMMNKYLDEIINIKELHNSENCIVSCGGDSINGNIHYSIAVTNKENVVKQTMSVSELISEFLAELSKHFKTVRFVSVAGNHSRVSPNKDMALPDERLDDMVEWYAKARLQGFDNIIFDDYDKIDPTMYLVNIRGKTYCGVHGDYDLNDSSVQALRTMAGVPLYAVISAHKHHNKSDTVQGVKTVMAGSFIGMDEYCVQKRIFGKPEQKVCVCDANGIKCQYDIDLLG